MNCFEKWNNTAKDMVLIENSNEMAAAIFSMERAEKIYKKLVHLQAPETFVLNAWKSFKTKYIILIASLQDADVQSIKHARNDIGLHMAWVHVRCALRETKKEVIKELVENTSMLLSTVPATHDNDKRAEIVKLLYMAIDRLNETEAQQN